LIGACGVMLSQDENPIFYVNASQVSKVSGGGVLGLQQPVESCPLEQLSNS